MCRKVADSIPDGVFGNFHGLNPSACTNALGLTQPLTEMRTRHISWGSKGSQCIGLTNLPPSHANFLEISESRHHGTLRTHPGIGFYVPILKIILNHLPHNSHNPLHIVNFLENGNCISLYVEL
jgi:hypothetical protein